MNGNLHLMRYEMKTILRDPMNVFMCVFPLLILALAAFVFPMIVESIDPAKEAVMQLTMLLLLVFVVTFGSYFLAAMATFLLLENKDECTLNTISVTPVGLPGYLRFKMAYLYVMGVFAAMAILLGTKWLAGDRYAIGGKSLFDNLEWWEVLAFAAVNGIFVPALALLQGAFAHNKVEGFAMIKGTGIIALLPALMILKTFHGGLQYVLGVIPSFWATKAVMLELFPIPNGANLGFAAYLAIGAAYNMAVLFAAYRLFLKKVSY